MAEPFLSVRSIRKAFANNTVVQDFNLDVGAGEFVSFLGPSVRGKTTVLRCVAGLQTLQDGHCSICGEVWQNGADFWPSHERSVGYVFQEASLFPHLSVRRNLLYGHRRAVRQGVVLGVAIDLRVGDDADGVDDRRRQGAQRRQGALALGWVSGPADQDREDRLAHPIRRDERERRRLHQVRDGRQIVRR